MEYKYNISIRFFPLSNLKYVGNGIACLLTLNRSLKDWVYYERAQFPRRTKKA